MNDNNPIISECCYKHLRIRQRKKRRASSSYQYEKMATSVAVHNKMFVATVALFLFLSPSSCRNQFGFLVASFTVQNSIVRKHNNNQFVKQSIKKQGVREAMSFLSATTKYQYETLPEQSTTINKNKRNVRIVSKTTTTKRKSRSANSDEVNEYLLETSMMDHDILTMEEEQALGKAIQRAQKLQKIYDKLIEEKQQEQKIEFEKATLKYELERNHLKLSHDDEEDEDDDDDDDDYERDEFKTLSETYGMVPFSSYNTNNDRRRQKKNMFELYFVGSQMKGRMEDGFDENNIMKRFDSLSLMSTIHLLQDEDDDENNDNGSLYDGDSTKMSSRPGVSTKLHPMFENIPPYDGSNTKKIIQVTDEDIRTHLKLKGGILEYQQILYDGAVARDTLIRCNIKLVNSIAKKWAKMMAGSVPSSSGGGGSSSSGSSGGGSSSDSTSSSIASYHSIYNGSWDKPSLSEAVQEGILGLIKAVERYNPNRNFRFSTYATYWITNSIRQCFQRASTGCLRLPINYYETKSKYKTMLKKYYEMNGSSSSPSSMSSSNSNTMSQDDITASLAREMNISLKRLRTILQYTRPLVSTDAPLLNGLTTRAGKAGNDVTSGNEVLLSDTLEAGKYGTHDDSVNGDGYSSSTNPDYNIELSFLRQCLENVMANELSPIERDIIRLRLGLDDGTKRTCTEVSKHCYNGLLSSSDVRMTEQKAYKKLRTTHTLSTYKLLSYIDFADIDMNTITFR